MIYLLEFETFDFASGQVVTERYANAGYTTAPGDVLSNVHFKNRIKNSGRYEINLFSSRQTQGAATVNFGFIELANPDGELDFLITQRAIDGRKLTIHAIADEVAPFDSRMLVFSGTMQQIETSLSTVTIRLRDRMAQLAKPLQTNLYKGTTISGGMNEAEGGPDDLKDKPKVMVWGGALNATPVVANRFSLVYHVSDIPLAQIVAVRDNGVPITFAQDYATLPALIAATIPSGRYATCLATGHIRLASPPAGDVTVDALEGAAGQRSAAAIAKRVLLRAGFVAGVDFDAEAFDALAAEAPAEMVLFVGTGNMETLSVLNALLGSVGAAIAPNRQGTFTVYRNRDPAGVAPVAAIEAHQIIRGTLERVVPSDEGGGVPAKKITLRYAKNETVQPNSLLDTTASQAIRAFATIEWRDVISEDVGVSLRHLLAPELDFETTFRQAADATAEAGRRMGLYGARREFYRLSVPLLEVGSIEVGKVITLRYPRFTLNAGKQFLVVGQSSALSVGRVQFDLWG